MGKDMRVKKLLFAVALILAASALDADNLYMAGRNISGDFYAHASYRVTGSSVALGEAVGKAVAGVFKPVTVFSPVA